jgi:outer membrane protein assembly factor BamE (lipoprotein component of BamABCDE complex)
MLKKVLLALTALLITGCYYAPQPPIYYKNPNYNKPHQPAVPVTNLTLGKIQKHIFRGMTEYEVISVLGSPNMVTGREDGTEAWIYDKQFTSVVHSGGKVIFAGKNGNAVSFDDEYVSPNTTKQLISHKTLTLIIDFNRHQRVAKFTYHYSSF